ncbi:MAG: mannose-1-phosphate guanylyltransferase [Bacteroidaceae bacterium]|nr:mannose-1-phosphate guanylyltransferase [Bacteroidaceae bacterium]
MRTHDYCIILAGGLGRRLWPTSRAQKPKQFVDFLGTGKSLLQITYERFAAFLPAENIYVATFADYEPWVREQLPQVVDAQLLLEPVQLSTGPMAAWASWHISQRDPQASIVATPADQLITNEHLFVEQVGAALDFVRTEGCYLAMGVKAVEPLTSYGYIQMGQPLGDDRYEVKSFTEKPPAEFAQTFVDSGEFLWNTGLFLWAAATMAPDFEQIIPGLVHADLIVSTREAEQALIDRAYPAAEFCTLDSLVLERSRRTVVQACHFGWTDIGTWPTLKEALPADVDGNATVGSQQVLFQGTCRTLVALPEGMGAVVRGLDGYVVSLEGNMLLIAPNTDGTLPRRLITEVQVRLGEDYV